MKRTLILCAALIAALTTFPLRGASPRDALIVNATWLKAHLDDPDLVLLHVGDKDEYAKSHIAGARLVSLRDVSVSDDQPGGLALELPKPDELRKRLEALGISDRSRIVVYYGNDWVSPATRVIFTLDHAGLGGRTSLLDGGMREWIRRGGAVTNNVPAAKTGQLSPLTTKPLVVDAAFVREHLAAPGYRVIDGRAAVYYDGVESGGMHGHDARGHIAGAASIPFTSITDDRGVVRSPEELQALFEKAGVKSGETVIGYCHIGQQATEMLFAARTLGHPVLLYDGSFQDWSRHAGWPVDNPSAKTGAK